MSRQKRGQKKKKKTLSDPISGPWKSFPLSLLQGCIISFLQHKKAKFWKNKGTLFLNVNIMLLFSSSERPLSTLAAALFYCLTFKSAAFSSFRCQQSTSKKLHFSLHPENKVKITCLNSLGQLQWKDGHASNQFLNHKLKKRFQRQLFQIQMRCQKRAS